MNEYRVTIVQTDPAWEQPAENLNHAGNLISSSVEETDAILLPEMFTTGFTMNSFSLAEEPGGAGAKWMKRIAEERNAAVGGSVIIRDKGEIFNRFLWVTPGGEPVSYDKRHLFFLERESNAYSRGKDRVVVKHSGIRILLSTCYDLRFPVWLRNRNDYDAIFLVANWPSARRDVWVKLLMARAIENQCYVAAVNRTGTDGNGLEYKGESMVIDYKGNIIHKASDSEEEVITIGLDREALIAFRQKFPVWLDADDFEIKP